MVTHKGTTQQGTAQHDEAQHGQARYGTAWKDKARQGKAAFACCGTALSLSHREETPEPVFICLTCLWWAVFLFIKACISQSKSWQIFFCAILDIGFSLIHVELLQCHYPFLIHLLPTTSIFSGWLLPVRTLFKILPTKMKSAFNLP